MFRDAIITAESKKKETRIFIYCMLIAFLFNVAGIIIYKSRWTELFSSLGYVLIIGIFFYLVALLVRLLIILIKWIFKK
jgi:hypothetical protein